LTRRTISGKVLPCADLINSLRALEADTVGLPKSG
jgi:hypothetical protein